MSDNLQIETRGRIRIVTITRPQVRNAVDAETARALHEAFIDFDEDDSVDVAVLTGSGNTFCAGADLHAIADESNRVTVDGAGPMGPTRMMLSKPVMAAVEGYAVAGGLELAIWCDLRVAAESATFGVFCRRFGVPLVDGGTVRLPRLIGQSRAMDLILTGRDVGAPEALEMGLVNRVVPDGTALEVAVELAIQLSALPQTCLRNDRLSVLGQWPLDTEHALLAETRLGLATIASGETTAGAADFAAGAGRHGSER